MKPNQISAANYWIKWYLGAWGVFLAVQIVLPFESAEDRSWTALLLTAIFALAFIGSFLLFFRVLRPRFSKKPRLRPQSIGGIRRTINLGLLLSLMGLTLSLYDRVVVQGVDYSAGVAVAREMWKAEGGERDSFSSWASLLGWGLGSAYFTSLVLYILHFEKFDKRARSVAPSLIFLLLLANSVLTGGRTILLLGAGFLLSALATRGSKGMSPFPRLGVIGRNTIRLLAGFVVIYFLWVFAERASMNSLPAREYTLGFVDFLLAEETENFQRIEALPEPYEQLTYFALMGGIYYVHSYYSFQSILASREKPGVIISYYWRKLLHKLDLSDFPEAYLFPGRFIPLHGALFYEFGFWGLLLGALSLGYILSIATAFVYLRGVSGTGLGVYASIITIILLSPMHPATEFLVFPFSLLGFILLSVLMRMVGGKVDWTVCKS